MLLRGDQGGSACKQLVTRLNHNITLTTIWFFFNESVSLSHGGSFIAGVRVVIFLFSSLALCCSFMSQYLLYNDFKVVNAFKVVDAFKLACTFLRVRSLFAIRRSLKSSILCQLLLFLDKVKSITSSIDFIGFWEFNQYIPFY